MNPLAYNQQRYLVFFKITIAKSMRICQLDISLLCLQDTGYLFHEDPFLSLTISYGSYHIDFLFILLWNDEGWLGNCFEKYINL